VVVKGGTELPGEYAVDVLFDGEEVTIYSEPKIGEERVSGAGCTFAAAITAELAKGSDIKSAVSVAKKLVTEGIKNRVESNAPFASIWQQA
jgi:pyridoxine kinase